MIFRIDNKAMKYYKRNWDELRGDEFDFWGTSTWYFECDEDDYVLRQMEIYANGNVLKYDESYQEDKYGGLAEGPLDSEEFAEFEITKDEFERVWAE
ncbi:DUF6881 domain-containing protein [Mucilaginibacter angelicae]|uniref:DUF6881 domain-containing protein n=1 Tax=Mucilaginibacter angelicae TaxID=869718 RepID=A0ABV6LH18_9SPHI